MCYVDIPRKSLCSNSPSLSFAEIESSHLLDCLLDMKQGLLPNSRNSMLTRLLRLCDIREGNGVNVVHFFIQSTIEDVLRVCFFLMFSYRQLAQSRSLNSHVSPSVTSHLTSIMSLIRSFTCTLPSHTKPIRSLFQFSVI